MSAALVETLTYFLTVPKIHKPIDITLCDGGDFIQLVHVSTKRVWSVTLWDIYTFSRLTSYPVNLRILSTPVSRIKYCPLMPSNLPLTLGVFSKL